MSDGISVYACLPEGVWDMVPSSAENVVDSTNLIDTGALLNIFGGNLMLKNSEQLISIDPDSLVMKDVGLTLDEGLPINKKGEITAMCSSWNYLFAAVKGPTYPSVFSYDGKGWHFLAKVPSAGATVRDLFICSSQYVWWQFNVEKFRAADFNRP